jgi:hypothetical protein
MSKTTGSHGGKPGEPSSLLLGKLDLVDVEDEIFSKKFAHKPSSPCLGTSSRLRHRSTTAAPVPDWAELVSAVRMSLCSTVWRTRQILERSP